MAGLDREKVQAWLDGYVEAWRTNDEAAIGALFADDVVYRYRPYGDRHSSVGLEALVRDWLENPDPADSWEAKYEPFAVDGDWAVATGYTRYLGTGDDPERVYRNVFLMRFAPEGRCAEFTDVYMLEERNEED